ncbi:glycerate kinase [Pseudonocardia nigra]|uniref:glycerate kinase n=1 Tax=Pseudonocardia nigra TaxID=1921578 RepID=UPI001C5F25E6|nr:glycerate kinase [Pseudonocardia nigra]
MHVVLAPDKFKGSLSAADVARHLTAGLRRAVPGVTVVTVPVADGGDGTLDAACAAGFRAVPVVATGPTGAPVHTTYAERGGEAVVELAAVSGLAQLPDGQPDALGASSAGTGELIAAALDAGCRRIVLGVGGSACTDGGAGMLGALGAVLRDVDGRVLPPGGGALSRVASLDLAGLHPGLASAEVVLASDVDNPLTGPRGAAAVFGPQKGATPGQVAILDAGLRRWAEVVAAHTGRDRSGEPGAGAAGGVGFAALALLGAQPRPGIDLVLELAGFDDALRGADLVVTGEGSLDEQTLRGKAPVGVAAAAAAAGVPVVAVAGRTTLSSEILADHDIHGVYSLTDLEPDPDRCIADAGRLLERVGQVLASEWVLAKEGA